MIYQPFFLSYILSYVLEADYIIVGQGVAGTLLSHTLMSKGKTVVVVDQPKDNTASKVASGIINPVTGRRVVSTWMIDELLPFAHDAYRELERELEASLISQKDILAFHATQQMQQAFFDKMDENDGYVNRSVNEDLYRKYFSFQNGIGVISPVYLIELQVLISKWREKLVENNSLVECTFNWDDCSVERDHVKYKNVVAEKIILCNGFGSYDDQYFNKLPYGITKGEALIMEIPDLPSNNIYKQGYSIVPWQDGLFWVGSSFDRVCKDDQPSEGFRSKVVQQIDGWLKLPYKIVDHIASVRAGTIDRRPFIGLHPLHKSIGIFNGMGTKGCSLAPYFAEEFSRHLIEGNSINELADIHRFTRILTR